MSGIVIVDFDNVVADTSQAVVSMLNEKTGRDMQYNPHRLHWDFRPYASTAAEQKWCLEQWDNPEMYSRLLPVKDVREGLEALHAFLRRPVVLCSARTGSASYGLLIDWLRRKKLYSLFDGIVLVSGGKEYVGSTDHRDDIIIDDRLDNMLHTPRKAGIVFGDYLYQDEDFAEASTVIKNLDAISTCLSWNDVIEYVELDAGKGVAKDL